MNRSDLLSFIRDGATTREEVLLKLGTPSAEFEGQRILTYEIRIDKKGEAHLIPPLRYRLYHNLVLVFGPDAVLEKHSLVGDR